VAKILYGKMLSKEKKKAVEIHTKLFPCFADIETVGKLE
jgi:hypothetical protein